MKKKKTTTKKSLENMGFLAYRRWMVDSRRQTPHRKLPTSIYPILQCGSSTCLSLVELARQFAGLVSLSGWMS